MPSSLPVRRRRARASIVRGPSSVRATGRLPGTQAPSTAFVEAALR
ncbi:MAG: hypothetical protein ACOZD0_14620 [Pseudomonadota bacterium]